MGVEEFSQQENKAPFNMALSTLEALRGILNRIVQLYIEPGIPDEWKQKMKIDLLKRFYIDSSPLLDDKIVDKYLDILKLKPKTLKIIDKDTQKANGRNKMVFDLELEIKLDNYLIQLQRELQRERYYMPPKKNLGNAVADFG